MKSSRPYKCGRPTDNWQKCEQITSLGQVNSDDVLIKDSRQFEATNLVRVQGLMEVPSGFLYNYAMPDGRAIPSPVMFAHDFELSGGNVQFFRAVKRES